MADQTAATPILAVTGLDAFYGQFQALFDITFDLAAGDVLAIIGANGAGKSTLLRCIAGLIRVPAEAVRFRGEAIGGQSADAVVKRGLVLVPEGRRLFPSLSVEENLVIGGQLKRPGRWSLDAIYDLFPILRERRNVPATSLSGGQQQMCAIGRALMANPDFIMFDEISLGLAPVVIKDIYAALPRVIAGGTGAIIVEQDISRALAVAGRVICLQEGRISLQGRPSELDRAAISAAYFGT
jgi:branched-chain amino acid transport system ATP-binding protein